MRELGYGGPGGSGDSENVVAHATQQRPRANPFEVNTSNRPARVDRFPDQDYPRIGSPFCMLVTGWRRRGPLGLGSEGISDAVRPALACALG